MSTRRRFLAGCAGCAAAWAAHPWSRLLAAEPAAPPPADQWTRTVCDLCGLGEPVFLRTEGGAVRAVKGIPQSRTGFGRLCARARALVDAAASADRALAPLVRKDPATKGTREGLVAASWDEALAFAAEGLRAARARCGPGAVAVLASDAETCETYGLLARVARAELGTDHLDTLARRDALTAYDACIDAYGVAANAATVEDVDAAGLLVLAGGDLADSHPGLFVRALDARRTGRAKVALIDSRRTLASAIADVHVRPRPGREADVVRALADALRTGRAREDVAPLAKLWRDARGVVTLVGPMALGGPAGGALVRAVATLHAATGQTGGTGRGFLVLPRGANATAVVAAGIRPGALPFGRRLADPAGRARVAAAWGVSADAFPSRAGLACPDWPDAVAAGTLGAIVTLRANPAAELPDASAWRAALASAFTVAATTHVPTETTAFADVVLPLAMVAGETAGTMMTLDRRCQRLERAVETPGEVRDAERILADLAGIAAPAPGASWELWRELAAGTPWDVTGVPASRLREELDVPWPCPAADAPGATRLDIASAHAARAAAAPPAPAPTAARPLLLLVGPLREHAGSRVRTGRTADLHYEAPSPRLEMHPADVSRAALTDGEWVTLESDTGEATVRLWATDRVAEGTLFLPEHFGFASDLQGGSDAQGEPEGCAMLLLPRDGTMPVPVSVRKARRRDLRRRALAG